MVSVTEQEMWTLIMLSYNVIPYINTVCMSYLVSYARFTLNLYFLRGQLESASKGGTLQLGAL